MDWLVWLLLAVAVLVLGSVVALWSYGRFARRAVGPSSEAIAPGEGAPLDRLLAPLEAAHAGQSGMALVFDPREAFVLRLRSAALATRSLDLLYYIWNDDLTGRLLAHALLEAADRGVRVRLLLDDVNVLGRDPLYLALDRHENINVRLFNPIRTRDKPFRRGFELLLNLVRYNRRMHGKAWIADGRLAVVGGRNVGNPYFAAQSGRRHNVDDIDMLLAGKAVGEHAAVFDRYWNSGVALPIRSLWHKRRTTLTRVRKRLHRFVRSAAVRGYLDRLPAPDATSTLPLARLRWVERVELVADPPEKALGTDRQNWLPEALLPRMLEAQSSIRILTPYFVPGSNGLASLLALAQRGVRIELVTNALAVADHLIVHGAYRWYRKPLLAAGIRVFEFCAADNSPPEARAPRDLARDDPGLGASGAGPLGSGILGRRARAMLHGKALLIDGKLGFVGSFNFDMRSAFLNIEMGLIFDDPVLLAELEARMDWASAPAQAYGLSLDGRFVRWHRGPDETHRTEPHSSPLRRCLSFVIGHMPIHRLL